MEEMRQRIVKRREGDVNSAQVDGISTLRWWRKIGEGFTNGIYKRN